MKKLLKFTMIAAVLFTSSAVMGKEKLDQQLDVKKPEISLKVDIKNFGGEMGYVKWFNAEKGFGYIEPLAGGELLFVLAKDINEPVKVLVENQFVGYDRILGPKGAQAVNVISL